MDCFWYVATLLSSDLKRDLKQPINYGTNLKWSICYLAFYLTGVGVRALQMGIRQAPLLHAPMGFVYSAAFTTTVGYFFESWVERNDELLELRLAKLKKLREASA